MSEQANAPRVWLRWAVALALTMGTVAGSIVPVFAQNDAPVEEPAPEPVEAPAPVAEESASVAAEPSFAEIVEAELVEAVAPVEALPPVDEAPPPVEETQVQDVPVEEVPVEEPVAAAPPPEVATGFDPTATNANLAVLGVGETEPTPVEAAPVETEEVAASGEGETAAADESSGEAAPLETEQTEETVEEPAEFGEVVSGLLGVDVTAEESVDAAASADTTGIATPEETTVAPSEETVSTTEAQTAGGGNGGNGSTSSGGGTTSGASASDETTGGVVNTADASRAAPQESSLQHVITALSGNSVGGGDVANGTNLDANAAAEGTAIADGSGGSNNAAVVEADKNDDGKVSVIERRRADRQTDKRAARRAENDNGNGNGGGKANGNNQNKPHRMGLAASRVAALNGRGLAGDTASAGNGGRANASADGGIVVIGTINSGGNSGNAIAVGDIGGGAYGECGAGSVAIDGGNVDNSTNIAIDAGGGLAISDASGGSDNLAWGTGNGYLASTGNGGIAGTTADGGIVVIQEINSGGNSGNSIGTGNLCAGPGGTIAIDGGNVDNSTNIEIDASGGTAIADASGGDDNLAVASGSGNDDDNRRRGGLRGLIQSRYRFGGRGIGGNVASAGNGGRANASADGGIVVIGAINSGGNRGNTINVGNIGGGAYGECGVGSVAIDGGNVDNSTDINIDASGGTAIADASGGSGNLAAVSGNDGGNGGGGAPIRSRYGLGARGNGGYGGDTASAGNGGIAGASADGGIVVIDEINSGGNQGNIIDVGNICTGPVYVPAAPVKPGKPAKVGKPGKMISSPAPRGGKSSGKGGKVRVTRMPSTGVGQVPAAPISTFIIQIAALPARREGENGGLGEAMSLR